tara:strand:- start:14 stop:478 length:465 start_codon:yes stop_codon:yes gene_type:complete
MIRRISANQVKDLLSDEELFNRVSDDSMTYEKFKPLESGIYLGMFHNGVLIGFWWLIPDNAITIDVHCNMLKEHRHLSAKMVDEFYRYAIDKLKATNKLICKIPVTFTDVYEFTKKHGFTDEGLDRQSVKKSGKILDRHILGITMQEIKNGCSK